MGALSLTVAYASRSGGAATPRVSFLGALDVPDDAVQGHVVSQAVAYGQTGPHSFSLTANAGGRFTITGAGELRVGGAALGAGPYSITVRATNGSDPAILTTRSVFVAAAGPTPPVAAGALPDLNVTVDSGVQTHNAAGDFSHAVDGAWSLPTAPAGVTISATGVVSVDTDATGLVADAAIVVRYANALGAAESAFAVTVAEALAAPPHAPAYFWDFSDPGTMTLSGEDVVDVTDKIGGAVATAGPNRPRFKPDATADGGPKGRLKFVANTYLELPAATAFNTRSISVFCVTRKNYNQWKRERSSFVSLGTATRDFILMKNQSQKLCVFTTSSNFADVTNNACASTSWAIGGPDNAWIGADANTFERGSAFQNRNPAGGWIGKFTSTNNNWDFTGDMQAVLLYDRPLTLAEKDEVLAWLSAAYETPGETDREYILDGDSITEGVGTGAGNDDVGSRVDLSYPAQMQLIDGPVTPSVHHSGVGGQLIKNEVSAAKVLSKLDGSQPGNNRIVFALYGNNDLAGGQTAAQIAADYETWMANIRAAHPDVRIGIGTVLNTTRWDNQNSRETHRLAFNDMVRGLSGSLSHDFFIDTQATPELQNATDLTYMTDGIHLTNAGYAALAATVRQGLDAQP